MATSITEAMQRVVDDDAKRLASSYMTMWYARKSDWRNASNLDARARKAYASALPAVSNKVRDQAREFWRSAENRQNQMDGIMIAADALGILGAVELRVAESIRTEEGPTGMERQARRA